MELLELGLHNYKCHRNKILKLSPGVTGIIGDNFTGKSSIISAICFLFTGDVDTSLKKQCITLGETDGWVTGKFNLNGKEGTLERHLTGSRVSLTYDGITYNKTSEVNALWSELLQIDSTIFNNVIVAKQGEIQSLFSDESIVREKIFQKIFMVPPTEKIRSCIWDNYIKTCPPERIEEDTVQLQSLQTTIAGERNSVLRSIDVKLAELGNESLIHCITDRLSFLERCRNDVVKKPEIESNILKCTNSKNVYIKELEELNKAKNELPSIESINKEKTILLQDKVVFNRRSSIENELNSILVNKSDIEKLEQDIRDIEDNKSVQYRDLLELTSKLKDVISNKNEVLVLQGKSICPTCKQKIPNIDEYLQSLMDQEVQLNIQKSKANSSYQLLFKQASVMQDSLAKMTAVYNRKDYLTQELSKIPVVDYSDDRYSKILELESAYHYIVDAIYTNERLKSEVEADLRVLDEKFNNLAKYDGPTSLDEEFKVLNYALQCNKLIQEQISELRLQNAKLEHELLLLDNRISTSGVNHKYNIKRKEYLDKLTSVHDIMHVSKFPRKLIETYMNHVQSSLSHYLEYFDLPQSVVIEEGFKIRLCDCEKRAYPVISGGQEIMVGICLRLALHKMFAKSFPMWIIDEGTTHLSELRRQNYFKLIEDLRSQKVINQILIIDHDERLSTVVDQVIQL